MATHAQKEQNKRKAALPGISPWRNGFDNFFGDQINLIKSIWGWQPLAGQIEGRCRFLPHPTLDENDND
jgi:hypothetical protein